LIEFD